jgi:hypothetical protein
MIDLTLSLDEINKILGVLGRQPYQEVEQLIAKVRRQALPQLQEPEAEDGVVYYPKVAE